MNGTAAYIREKLLRMLLAGALVTTSTPVVPAMAEELGDPGASVVAATDVAQADGTEDAAAAQEGQTLAAQEGQELEATELPEELAQDGED